MRGYRALLAAEFKVFLRDKAAITFTFLFPILFILIFGFLMADVGTVQHASIGVSALSGADATTLESVISSTGFLSWREFPDRRALENAIEGREVDFGVAWDGQTLTFIYDIRRTQENFAFEEVASGISSRFNLANQGQHPMVRVQDEVVGGQAEVSWLTLVVPGILAFSILSAGLFAVAGHITSMKQRKLLDRMIVTPMRPPMLLGAVVLVRLAVVFTSTLLTLGLAIVVFRLTYNINWVLYAVFLIASTVGTMGMGTVIALVVRQASSASNLASAISLTMMFVSGIYFPVEIMPPFLRALSLALPLRYMADAMRYVTGVMDMTATRFWAISGTLLLVGVGMLPLLSRYVIRADRR